MRIKILCAAALLLCLCACMRESLTDPVLFCKAFNRLSQTVQLREENAFLRADDEVLLYGADVLIRLQTDERGAVHTAVVTGPAGKAYAETVRNAFTVLSRPLSEDVPQEITAVLEKPPESVFSVQTDRFEYLVYSDGTAVTAVQINRQLFPITAQPRLRR
ncbi:MAG: hypothetical protein IJT44_13205 [Clostridia bacterium]|nr:hypothetical protein [Clostridia bacterium]